MRRYGGAVNGSVRAIADVSASLRYVKGNGHMLYLKANCIVAERIRGCRAADF